MIPDPFHLTWLVEETGIEATLSRHVLPLEHFGLFADAPCSLRLLLGTTGTVPLAEVTTSTATIVVKMTVTGPALLEINTLETNPLVESLLDLAGGVIRHLEGSGPQGPQIGTERGLRGPRSGRNHHDLPDHLFLQLEAVPLIRARLEWYTRCLQTRCWPRMSSHTETRLENRNLASRPIDPVEQVPVGQKALQDLQSTLGTLLTTRTGQSKDGASMISDPAQSRKMGSLVNKKPWMWIFQGCPSKTPWWNRRLLRAPTRFWSA
jgi:hypothetical protein